MQHLKIIIVILSLFCSSLLAADGKDIFALLEKFKKA